MFKDINPAKEIELFKGLAKSGQKGTLKKAIDEYFPSSLLLKLPSNIISDILKEYPLNSKIELIASLPEEEKESLMDILAPEGSTLRDLISIEFENLEQNEAKMISIFKQKDKIFTQFSIFARKKINQSTNYEDEIEQIKSKFIQELNSGPGEKGKLKLAA
jgi:hypothetical protein